MKFTEMKSALTNWTAFYELGALCIVGLEKNHSGYSRVEFERVPDEFESGLIVYRAYFGENGESVGSSGDLSTIHFHDFTAPTGIKKVRLYFEDSRIEFPVRKRR